MPELDALANQNINFFSSYQIVEVLTLEGTQWTIASMVGQEAGIPLLVPFNSKSYNDKSNFLVVFIHLVKFWNSMVI